jgi:hypothetical protein
VSESPKHEGEEPEEAAPVLEEHEGARMQGAAEHGKSGLLAELLELERSGELKVAVAAPGSEPPPHLGTRVGRLVEWASGEPPTVEFEGNERGPLPARSVIPLSPSLVAAAIQDQRGVLLCFEDGRPDAPIITGLLQPLGAEVGEDTGPDEAELPEAHIDGRRVELEAADEIVLRCGKASIVLRRNGRVVIRGTYVETRSRGVNRIKGGSVEIN